MKVARHIFVKQYRIFTLGISFLAIFIMPLASGNIAGAQISSTGLQDVGITGIWSEPESGTLFSEILIYANFCSILENYSIPDSLLNVTAILERPDGQTEQLTQFANVKNNGCERVPAYSFIPQLPGDHVVHLVAHIDNTNLSSDPITVRADSLGMFQSGKVTVILDSEKLRAMNHAPDQNYAYRFRILDWSNDGKFILFVYHDYASFMDSLGIIDVKTYNVTSLDILDANENSTDRIYLAKFSPTSDSVFVLIGSNSGYTGKPENIFKYDLENRTLDQITNSSNVYWFDTLANVDGATLIYVSDHTHLWPEDDEELSRKIQSIAGKYYPYLTEYLENAFGTISGSIAINEDASKLIFTGTAGGLVEPGVFLVDVQSGEEKKIMSRSPCVGSVEFAPNDDLILYGEHPEQLCPDTPVDLGGTLRIATLDGTLNEIVYNDRQFVPSGVLSPDGRFVATVGNAYMVEDQYPKLLMLELPRPVPEFGVFLVPIFLTFALCIVVAYSRFRK